MNPTNPEAQELLNRAFTLACCAALFGNDAQKASDEGRGGDAWAATELAVVVNRAALNLLTQAARTATKVPA